MSFGLLRERARALTIKDEGVILTTNASSIDLVGLGVESTVVGSQITHTINDTIATWGGITGTLSDQTDIQSALDLKVTGPSVSTDNAIPRYDGLTGKIVQDSGVIITDSNEMTIPSALNVLGDTTLRGVFIEGGVVASVTTQTTTYSITFEDYVILCDASSGAFSVTLPTAGSNTGRIYYIKKIDSSSNAVTVDGNGSETIDDGTTASITIQYEVITVQSDGSQWYIL